MQTFRVLTVPGDSADHSFGFGPFAAGAALESFSIFSNANPYVLEIAVDGFRLGDVITSTLLGNNGPTLSEFALWYVFKGGERLNVTINSAPANASLDWLFVLRVRPPFRSRVP